MPAPSGNRGLSISNGGRKLCKGVYCDFYRRSWECVLFCASAFQLMSEFSRSDTAPGDPKRNLLLAALGGPDYRRLLSHLEWVDMPLSFVIYESGKKLEHVYFPTTSVVALLHVMKNGSVAESAIVGNEGLVGVSLFMGGETTSGRAMVQIAGHGYRMKAVNLKREFDTSVAVQSLLLRYTQALITQMSQNAVCNRHHSIDKQLSRFLLVNLDRLQGDELPMTHELIASMLGVRREGVTEAAQRLQKSGAIQYARGKIQLLSRPELESRACECYALVKDEYDRLLPPLPAEP